MNDNQKPAFQTCSENYPRQRAEPATAPGWDKLDVLRQREKSGMTEAHWMGGKGRQMSSEKWKPDHPGPSGPRGGLDFILSMSERNQRGLTKEY